MVEVKCQQEAQLSQTNCNMICII